MSVLEPDRVVAKAGEILDVSLSSPVAALAAVVHAINLQLDFRLTSTLPAFDDSQSDFVFRYAHNQSAMTFEIKVGKLGQRAIINGIAVEDDKTRTLEIPLRDYLSTSAFSPSVRPADVAGTFNSPARLRDLINDYKRAILQPLIPGLQKEGYSDEATASDARNVAREGPPRGFYPDGGGPMPDAGRPYPASPLQARPSNIRFPNIGGSDLEPLGGLGGTTGPRVPLGGNGGDGMMVGPNHPLFRDRFTGEDPLQLPGRGPWGGDGFLPPMGAPPGARFDPVGPFMGGPRPGQGGFGNPNRGGGGPGPRGPGGFPGGEPDWDEAIPPRGDSEYDNMFS